MLLSRQLRQVTIEVSSETIADDAAYTVIRTFTATDDAGNSTSGTQTIAVLNDRSGWTFLRLYQYDDLIFDDASATDNCGGDWCRARPSPVM